MPSILHRACTRSSRRTPPTVAALAALAALVLAAAPAHAQPCTTDCAQTACAVDCTELAVRDAVVTVNDCVGDPGWTGRTLTLAGPQCEIDGTVVMENDAGAGSSFLGTHPGSYCPGDPEDGAVCILNDDVHVVGSGASFVYDGPEPCGQCSGQCPTGAALFTIKGNRNTVEDITFRYFPEGIHVRIGDGHTVANVTSDRICEDAITIDNTAGTGIVVRDLTLLGSQPADAPHACVLANGSPGLCGTDKAIQVNGGASTISGNQIHTISQPISIGGGTHVVADNTSHGSLTDQNVCQSYTVSGAAHVTFAGNTVDHCKFGFRIDGDATVVADGNTVTEPWVSAFNVRTSGRLKAEGNRVRTRTSGFTNVSDAQRGIVVARSDRRARIDLGGGDFDGVSVIDDAACAAGGDCSAGNNVFCSTGGGAQIDIWNLTDCPCLDQFCGGVAGLCTVHSCAPLDADGGCQGSGGGGASIGARGNCFLDAAVEVQDDGTVTTDTSGLRACSPVECDF